MLQKLNAEETLEYLIGVVKANLGVQLWNKAAERGLEGALEEQYPI